MKIKTCLFAVAASVALSACGAETGEDPAQEAAASVAETPEEKVAKIAASMTPRDYRLKVVTCNYLLKAAPRAPEGSFSPELTARVAAIGEGIEFFKLTRWFREIEPEAQAFNEAQSAGLSVRLPRSAEEATAEYKAQIEECTDIVAVEKPKVEAAS